MASTNLIERGIQPAYKHALHVSIRGTKYANVGSGTLTEYGLKSGVSSCNNSGDDPKFREALIHAYQNGEEITRADKHKGGENTWIGRYSNQGHKHGKESILQENMLTAVLISHMKTGLCQFQHDLLNDETKDLKISQEAVKGNDCVYSKCYFNIN